MHNHRSFFIFFLLTFFMEPIVLGCSNFVTMTVLPDGVLISEWDDNLSEETNQNRLLKFNFDGTFIKEVKLKTATICYPLGYSLNHILALGTNSNTNENTTTTLMAFKETGELAFQREMSGTAFKVNGGMLYRMTRNDSHLHIDVLTALRGPWARRFTIPLQAVIGPLDQTKDLQWAVDKEERTACLFNPFDGELPIRLFDQKGRMVGQVQQEAIIYPFGNGRSPKSCPTRRAAFLSFSIVTKEISTLTFIILRTEPVST